MSDNTDDSTLDLILTEVRGISASVTSLTRHVDRMDDRLGHVEQDTSQLKQDVTVLKQDVSVLREDVGFIKNAVTEQSADLDDHEQRIQHLEREAA